MEVGVVLQAVPVVRWPADASEEYIQAREELRRNEIELDAHIQRVAAQRHALPLGAKMREYAFREGPRDLSVDEPVDETRLADLVPDDRSLVVYHMMFSPQDDEACPMCSTWVDGLYGVSHHLRQRADFVVISKAPLPKLRNWARHRGWDGLRILSSYGTNFNPEIGSEDEQGNQQPLMSVFVKRDGLVRHVYSGGAYLDPAVPERGMDLCCSVWHVWDLIPEGRADWYAGNDYAGRERG